MSVLVARKPLDHYSPRHPPLPVITLRSLTLPHSDYHPGPPPLTAETERPSKLQKHKKEDRKKKKGRQKRSKSCPPVEVEGSKKKVRLPAVAEKKKATKDVPNNTVTTVAKSKTGKSAPPAPRLHTGTTVIKPPPTPPPRVRLVTIAKLKEEDMREKLRQSVFKLTTRSKPGEGLIVVEGSNKKADFVKPYHVPATQGIHTAVIKDHQGEEPSFLKYRRYAFHKQLDENARQLNDENLKSRSASKLKKCDSDKLEKSSSGFSDSKCKSSQSQKKSSILPSPPPDIRNTRPSAETVQSNTAKASSSNQKTSSVPPSRSVPRNPSSTPSDSTSSDKSPSKSKKNISLLVKIKPINQESERDKFFSSNFHYNPQFVYRNVASQNEMDKFSQASGSLLHIAIKIMRVAIRRYGTYEKFEEKTGGPKLSRSQTAEAAHAYLKSENLQDEVTVMLSDDLLSRACMSRMNGKPTLLVRTGCMRQNWVQGMLRHEIGTHYLRSCNNRMQVWHQWRKRRDLDMLPINPTEEGLASLHSLIFREDPNLWRAALLYYVIYQASRMSFVELFKDVAQFVKDPAVRWDYCLRAKRGMEDTSQPGAFCKDQVYLKGVLQILRNRRHIDFHLLIRAGKVDFRDLDKLRYVVDTEKTRIPSFMQDIYIYRLKLEEIFMRNQLTDADLENIEELNR